MGSPQQRKITFFFSCCKDNVKGGVFTAPPGRERKGWPRWRRHNADQEHIKFLFHLLKNISTLTTLDHHPHSVLPVYSSAAYLCSLLCTELYPPNAVSFSFPFPHCPGFIFNLAVFNCQKFSCFCTCPLTLPPFVSTYCFHLQHHK